ncbi:hypothetical protein PI95_015390 [Hassallia byssoidea VB512170]|uniref:Uncharacterized protein n=1 Tax=Hassallia byssoidea VB512170 TaxID=1304833 RepID=A0A846H9X3_9CYAN|nr:hypothetical protein [Hassalia byssoidea]NEU73903.1 hypothetical protein [Hassalia byssoidea VB512170]
MSPRARLPVPSIRSGEPEGGWSPVVAPAVGDADSHASGVGVPPVVATAAQRRKEEPEN